MMEDKKVTKFEILVTGLETQEDIVAFLKAIIEYAEAHGLLVVGSTGTSGEADNGEVNED